MNHDDDVRRLVFATGSVVGGEGSLAVLEQGFSCLSIDAAANERATSYRLYYDETVQVDDGTFLVTAALLSVGAHARPGAVVAYLRVGAFDEVSAIYHEVASEDEVEALPYKHFATAVVPEYQGRGWLERATVRVLDVEPDRAPPPIDEWPVNVALRDLGVRRGERPDEASAIGLRLPRHP